MTNDEIIKEEIDSILEDIIKAYRASGRKVTGQFEEGLEVVYEPNKATIKGFVYLTNRTSKKIQEEGSFKGLISNILEWLKNRGIRPLEKEMKQSSLAFLISRKIWNEGTDESKWLKVYEEVITPQRISQIIERVRQLNVNKLITETRARLEVLAKNV